MSTIEDVFDEFEEEDKTSPEDVKKPAQKPDSEAVSVPEGVDESKEKVEKDAPAKSTEDDVDDWFETVEEETAKDQPVEDKPAEDKPVEDKPAEDKPVEEVATDETPAEETTTTDEPIVVDDWFQPSEDQAPAETPSEVTADAVFPMGVEASPIVVPAVSAAVMRASMQQFQSLKAGLLDKSDIATIQNKPFIKRSGWRKLALAFNISDEIIKDERVVHNDDFECRIWVKVWAPNGRSVVGIGACSSKERNFAHVEHDVYATAHTRAKNRALSDLIGSGEISWEELRGFG